MTLQEQWERQKQEQQEERRRRAGAGHTDRQPDAEDPLEEEGTFSDEGTRG